MCRFRCRTCGRNTISAALVALGPGHRYRRREHRQVGAPLPRSPLYTTHLAATPPPRMTKRCWLLHATALANASRASSTLSQDCCWPSLREHAGTVRLHQVGITALAPPNRLIEVEAITSTDAADHAARLEATCRPALHPRKGQSKRAPGSGRSRTRRREGRRH